MTTTRELVQVVAGEHLVLRAEFEKFKCLLVGLALEHIQIFNNKLILFSPAYAQALRVILCIQVSMRLSQRCQATDTAWIEQVEDLLVVDLQERCEDTYVSLLIVILPNGFNLLKKLLDAALSNTVIHLARVVVWHFSLVTLHGKRLATARLTVGEDRAMIAVNDTVDEATNTETFEDAILIVLRSKHLIEVVKLATIEAAERVVHFARAVIVVAVVVRDLNILVIANGQLVSGVPLMFLMWQHGPDSYADLDARASKALLFFSCRRQRLLAHSVALGAAR